MSKRRLNVRHAPGGLVFEEVMPRRDGERFAHRASVFVEWKELQAITEKYLPPPAHHYETAKDVRAKGDARMKALEVLATGRVPEPEPEPEPKPARTKGRR